MSLNSHASLPGFDITVSPTEGEEGFVSLDHSIQVSRSGSVLFFSSIVMLIMWILAVLSLLLAIQVWRSGELPDVGMLGLMAALLFAFPSIRDAQPHVPPVGTLGDFMSFFWAEIIVVVALVIIGIARLRRYHPPKKA